MSPLSSWGLMIMVFIIVGSVTWLIVNLTERKAHEKGVFSWPDNVDAMLKEWD